MAYDEGVAQRLREGMQEIPGISEKKMFGGIAFMVHGNMCVGVVKDTLMLRVGADRYNEVLKHRHVRKMDFTGKPMTGFVYVDPEGFESDADLEHWINIAYTYVRELPSK